MSSDVQAKCTNSLAVPEFGVIADAFLEEIFDRLDVVVRRALDHLDAFGILQRKPVGDCHEKLAGRGGQRLDFGDSRLVDERQQPAHLDEHAAMHQSEFAENRTQRLGLAGVAAVERRQGGERGQGHRGDPGRTGANDSKRKSIAGNRPPTAGCRRQRPQPL